jgi:hypothetical protein
VASVNRRLDGRTIVRRSIAHRSEILQIEFSFAHTAPLSAMIVASSFLVRRPLASLNYIAYVSYLS